MVGDVEEDILESKAGIMRGFLRLPRQDVQGRKEEFTNYWLTKVFKQPSEAWALPDPDDLWYELVLCEHHPERDDVDDACKEPMHRRPQFPPAMVVQVDRAILPDHGRIFTAPLMEYVLRIVNARLATRTQ